MRQGRAVLIRPGGAHEAEDRVDDFLDDSVGHSHFDADFRQEAHFVFSAAVDFRLALLTAIAAYFGHGHARRASGGHGVEDGVQTARFEHCGDVFHWGFPFLFRGRVISAFPVYISLYLHTFNT